MWIIIGIVLVLLYGALYCVCVMGGRCSEQEDAAEAARAREKQGENDGTV